MKKFEYRENAPKEFIFKNQKYITVECKNGVSCDFCDIGNKNCSLYRGERPSCLGTDRTDGKDVYFKKI